MWKSILIFSLLSLGLILAANKTEDLIYLDAIIHGNRINPFPENVLWLDAKLQSYRWNPEFEHEYMQVESYLRDMKAKFDTPNGYRVYEFKGNVGSLKRTLKELLDLLEEDLSQVDCSVESIRQSLGHIKVLFGGLANFLNSSLQHKEHSRLRSFLMRGLNVHARVCAATIEHEYAKYKETPCVEEHELDIMFLSETGIKGDDFFRIAASKRDRFTTGWFSWLRKLLKKTVLVQDNERSRVDWLNKICGNLRYDLAQALNPYELLAIMAPETLSRPEIRFSKLREYFRLCNNWAGDSLVADVTEMAQRISSKNKVILSGKHKRRT